MIVIDASALVDALTDESARGERAARALCASRSLHAPAILDLETVAAIRRMLRLAHLELPTARRALARLGDVPIDRYEHTPHLPRIWELRDLLSPYDAAYLALAEALQAKLVTSDRALAAVASETCEVEYVTA